MNLPALALNKVAAEAALDALKTRFTHDALLRLSDAQLEAWKAEMKRRWENVIDAQLAYYRAKDEVNS